MNHLYFHISVLDSVLTSIHRNEGRRFTLHLLQNDSVNIECLDSYFTALYAESTVIKARSPD